MQINRDQIIFWENLKDDASQNSVPGAIKAYMASNPSADCKNQPQQKPSDSKKQENTDPSDSTNSDSTPTDTSGDTTPSTNTDTTNDSTTPDTPATNN